MGTPFHVELLIPERVLFSGEADEVSMRVAEGEITFLARHEDYIGVAGVTVARIRLIRDGGEGKDVEPEELRAAVHGGFVHVDREGVVILARAAELASEIDVARARAALGAAEGWLDAGPPPTTQQPEASGDSPEAAAQRARVRLEAAGATVRR